MRPINSELQRVDISAVSSSFGDLSPHGGSLASMNVVWLPNRKLVATTLVFTSLLLVWGTALGGRSYGPVRSLLRALPYGDKVGHFGLYGTITLAVAMLVRTRHQAIGAGVAVIALGVADEFRQLTEPNRNFSINDVLANLGGVSVGLLAALLVARFASWWSSRG